MEIKALKPTFSFKLQSRIGGAKRAALAEETDIAGLGDGSGECGVEADVRHHHAETIRSDDAHAGTAGVPEDLLFQLDPFRAGFLEARQK